VFGFIKEEIEFIPFDEFIRYAAEAETLAPHAKDVHYFALALAFDAAIWSNEKAFTIQSELTIYSTAELLALVSQLQPLPEGTQECPAAEDGGKLLMAPG
jgi:predicted nucleic acid-binding protein